eukprot:8430333-Ditylum_brightwellii.AAC.1
MEAVHRGNFARKCPHQVKGTTACEILDHVYVVLEEYGLGNPSKTAMGCLKLTLGHQIRGYVKADPPPKCQKAFPPSVYCNIIHNANTLIHCACAILLIGTF